MIDKYILLVEDNPDDEELTMLALKQASVVNEVVVVRDGEEALHYLLGEEKLEDRAKRRMPELILMDLDLPKIGGLEVLERLRADSRTALIPIVILTSSADEEDRVAGYRRGANSYVRKPVGFHQFAEVVRHIGLYWLLVNETSVTSLKGGAGQDGASEEDSLS